MFFVSCLVLAPRMTKETSQKNKISKYIININTKVSLSPRICCDVILSDRVKRCVIKSLVAFNARYTVCPPARDRNQDAEKVKRLDSSVSHSSMIANSSHDFSARKTRGRENSLECGISNESEVSRKGGFFIEDRNEVKINRDASKIKSLKNCHEATNSRALKFVRIKIQP